MPFCPECGKPVTAKAKFCKSCGASQLEEALPVPAPAAQVTGTLSCTACGGPLAAGEKFCGLCGAKAGSAPVATAAPVAVPAAVPVPPPFAAPIAPAPGAPVAGPAPGGVRTCTACGNLIRPGDKFCSKCLVIVKDAPAGGVPVPPPAPAAPAGVPAPAPYTCAACGSPFVGSEKFCGTCGAPAVAARAEPASPPPKVAAAPAAPAVKVCGKCGAVVSETTKFCGACGAPIGVPAPASPASPASQPGGEQVIGVIANARRMKMLGASWDTYNLVVTDRRLIIARLTQEMLNAAIAEAQAKAKAEGKGFFGIMGDQMAAQFQFARKYETMSPDAVLQETPGNTAIANAAISALDLKLYDDDNATYSEFRLIIKSGAGNNEFRIGEDDRFINILKTAYGDRVHMPFGYFRAGGVKLKFF